MIITGNPAGNAGFWSKHLLRDDTNEKAEIKEITGLAATDLPSALKEMKAVASGSRCEGNFMYQANINPLAHEKLTAEQWREAINTLEHNLGLTGHQRVVVEHIKEGRQHFHIVWNRIDVETMRVADMGGNYFVHENTSRELEKKFGLTPTKAAEPNEKKRTDELWEKRAAERSGVDIGVMRHELTTLWRQSDSGAAFKAAIEEKGYILAKGDRRDFCVIDRAGDAHSLARRLAQVKAAEVRAHMSDIDRNALPSVQDARETQRSRPPIERPHVETPKYDLPKSEKKAEAKQDGAAQATVRKELSEGGTKSANIKLPGIGVTNMATGVAEKLVDFVAHLLDGATGSPKPPQDQVDRLLASRKAQGALENIREHMERGASLRPEDILYLTRDHLENIRAKGDSYLQELISQMESEKERHRDYERGRTMER